MTDNSVDRTIVAFGMTASGTTPLIQRYVNDIFDYTYVPTSRFDHFSTSTVIDDRITNLTIIDTPGIPTYGFMRKKAYKWYSIDAALFCCSVNDLWHLEDGGFPVDYIAEFREYYPDAPIIFVITMIDLEANKTAEEKRIATKIRQQITEQIGAVCYVECSALKNQGVREVFDKAIDVIPKMTALERWSRKYLGIPKMTTFERWSRKYLGIPKHKPRSSR